MAFGTLIAPTFQGLDANISPSGEMDITRVFGTDRQGFDNPHNKIITICFHGEMDITIDFGSIIEGSNPSGSTNKKIKQGDL